MEQARKERLELFAAATAPTTAPLTVAAATANPFDADVELLNTASAAAFVFSEPEMATTLLDAQAETSVDVDLIQSHVEPMDLTHDELMEFDGMDFQDDFYGMSVSTVEPRSKLDAGFLQSAPPFRSVLDPPPGIFVDTSGELAEIPVSDYTIEATEAGGIMKRTLKQNLTAKPKAIWSVINETGLTLTQVQNQYKKHWRKLAKEAAKNAPAVELCGAREDASGGGGPAAANVLDPGLAANVTTELEASLDNLLPSDPEVVATEQQVVQQQRQVGAPAPPARSKTRFPCLRTN